MFGAGTRSWYVTLENAMNDGALSESKSDEKITRPSKLDKEKDK